MLPFGQQHRLISSRAGAALVVALAGSAIAGAARSAESGDVAATGAATATPAPNSIERDKPISKTSQVRLETVRRDGERYIAELDSGEVAELTLNPRLQAAAEDVLRKPAIRYGASVVISIPDGRVLALAGRSSVDTRLGPAELALRPWAPAASVFKIVSAAALVEDAGLTSESQTCYHGGKSSVLPDNLVDSRKDRACASLGYGIGKSQNAILAKLAVRHLSPEQLARMGRAFGFNETLAFDLPFEPSRLDVPESNPLEFARTAAGFWHSTLSPMHGALIAAAMADGGQMLTPKLVDRVIDSNGAPVTAGEATLQAAPPPRQVVSSGAAAEVAKMMALVTRQGTARAAFHDHRGRPRLPFSAAGKTGTLFGHIEGGAVGYSWFVGFAPVENPTVAFAVALGSRIGNKLKASQVAREILSQYALESSQAPGARASAGEPAGNDATPRRALRPQQKRGDARRASRETTGRNPSDWPTVADLLGRA